MKNERRIKKTRKMKGFFVLVCAEMNVKKLFQLETMNKVIIIFNDISPAIFTKKLSLIVENIIKKLIMVLIWLRGISVDLIINSNRYNQFR